MSITTLSNHATIQTRDWLHGVIADVPTPFLADEGLDLATFARLCERQIAAGATAIIVGGTVGEGDTLTEDERMTLIRTAVGICRGRLRVIAGGGSNSTSRAIEWTRLARVAGADAVISVVPYYNKPTIAGVHAHFQAVLDNAPLPIVLYDSPGRCVRMVADETILQLAASSRVIGLCDDTGDTARLARLRSTLPVGFRLVTSEDGSALSYLLSGGDGVVWALANVAPQLCSGMYYATRKNRARYAMTIADMLAPLAAELPQQQVSSAVKYALSLRGLGSPAVRLPRLKLTDEEQNAVRKALQTVWASPDDAMPSALLNANMESRNKWGESQL